MENPLSLKNIFPGNIARDWCWRAGQILLKQLFGALLMFYSAAHLNSSDFGVFSYLLTLLSFFLLFADFGISGAASLFVARYAVSDIKRSKQVFSTVSLILIPLLLLFMLILTYTSEWLGYEKSLIIYLYPAFFCMPFVSLLDGVYRGLRSFRLSTSCYATAFLTGGLSALWLVPEMGITGALLALNLFYITLLLTFIISKWKEFGGVDLSILKESQSTILLMGTAGICHFLYSRVDILVLERMGFIEQIGYYELIDRSFIFILMPFVILAQVIAPRISGLMESHGLASVKAHYKRSLQIIIPAGLVLTTLGYFAFHSAVQTLLPAYYTADFILILHLLLFLLPIKIFGVFSTNAFITPSGYVKIITLTAAVAGLLNLAADIILIRLMGFVGVFIATLVIHSSTIILQQIMFMRNFPDAPED